MQANYPPETLFVGCVERCCVQHEVFDRGRARARRAGRRGREFEVSAALKMLERRGLLSRGGRGEGEWIGAGAPRRQGPPADAAPRRARCSRRCVEGLRPRAPARGQTLGQLARRSGLDEERCGTRSSCSSGRGRSWRCSGRFAGRALQCLRHERLRRAEARPARGCARQERQALLLLKRMTDYAYSKRCRRAFILRYFGEECASARPAGRATSARGPAWTAMKAPAAAPEGRRSSSAPSPPRS